MNTFTTLPRPTAVKPNGDYTLDLTFNNGERRVFDANATGTNWGPAQTAKAGENLAL